MFITVIDQAADDGDDQVGVAAQRVVEVGVEHGVEDWDERDRQRRAHRGHGDDAGEQVDQLVNQAYERPERYFVHWNTEPATG